MNDVDKVKNKVDIVEYIRQFVELQRAGQNFKGLCPFHSEKSPSFMVSPERQTWHCFGCQKGGDVFTFFMEYEKTDFSESLKELAQRAGVQLTQPVFRTQLEKKKDILYTINAAAAQFYHYLLTQHAAGKDALKYLTQERGMNQGLIEKFQLGYAPHKPNALFEYLFKKRGFAAEDIQAAGLAGTGGGNRRDFFSHRIIFPIHDIRSNIIAFSGRTLEDSGPKYINTRETQIYKKSSSLYGIFFAKEAIRSENKVLVVEGEFDVISCMKEGIGFAVALKGTALTEDQIKLLKRYADKILFCFDTDVAGTAAQKRSIALLEKEGLLAAVIVPPEGKDPDELLREQPALFKKALKSEVNVYDFIIDSAVQATDMGTPEGKRRVLDETLPILSQIDNEVIKEHYLKKLAKTLDSSYESVLRQSQKNKTAVKPMPVKPEKQQHSREEITELYLLALVMQAKNPFAQVQKVKQILDGIELTTPAYDKLWTEIRNFSEESSAFSRDDFAKQLPAEILETFDTTCLVPIPEFSETNDYDNEVVKVATDTATLAVKEKIREISEKVQDLEKNPNDDTMAVLQEKFTVYTQRLAAIKRAS
jgi:DNA primase